MINRELLQPKSIVVIGGSNNVHKPGGAIVRNLMSGGFDGTLRIVNPKEDEVQGIKVFHAIEELPPTELAILVRPAKLCPDSVEELAAKKEHVLSSLSQLDLAKRRKPVENWRKISWTSANNMEPRSSVRTASDC